MAVGPETLCGALNSEARTSQLAEHRRGRRQAQGSQGGLVGSTETLVPGDPRPARPTWVQEAWVATQEPAGPAGKPKHQTQG